MKKLIGLRLSVVFLFGLVVFSSFQNCSQQSFLSLSHQQDLSSSQSSASEYGSNDYNGSFSAVFSQSHSDLAKGQPPVDLYTQDKLGININCNYWNMNDAALNDCVQDLDLAKGLGISSVRLGIHWYMLTDANGYTLTPWKVKFMKAYLNAARSRGLKILFTVNLEAPSSAYNCSSVQNKPTKPSTRLDFCDDIFLKYFSNLMDLILPYTPYVEFLNETNWGFDKEAPFYKSLSIQDYILGRSKETYLLAKSVLEEKKLLGYSYVLLSQGISYFYDPNFPQRGWPSFNSSLIFALDYLHWMKFGWQPQGKNIYDDIIDIIAFHPYFDNSDYKDLVSHFISKANQLSQKGKKTLWMTETSSAAVNNSETIAVFNQLKIFLGNNSIQKAFWFAVRVNQIGNVSNPEGHFGVYDYARNLQQPELADAMKRYNSQFSESIRFLPEEYRNMIEDKTTTTVPVAKPTCQLQAQDGALKYDGSVEKEGLISWDIANAKSADYKCFDTVSSYTEIGSLGPMQSLALKGTRYIKSSLTCKITSITKLDDTKASADSFSQCQATALMVKLEAPVPSCEMTAENGIWGSNGSVLKPGKIIWSIKNAKAAEYYCKEGSSYEELGKLGPGQKFGLIDSVNTKNTLNCRITSFTKLDGTIILNPSFCGAISTFYPQ